MKKTSILSAFSRIMCFGLLLTLAISSCKKSETPVAAPQAKVEIDATTIAKIKEMGFRTDSIRVFGESYIVEGDILITKESLSTPKAQHKLLNGGGKIAQVNTDNVVLGNLTNIIIATEDYDTRWHYAIREAVAAWNAISNCRINLIHSYSQFYPPYSNSVTPTITIKKANLGTGGFGLGQPPTGSGSAGAIVYVNPFTNNTTNGYDNGIPRSHEQDVYMLVHEIGHCLGFRHTDWAAEGVGDGANPIAGTPSNGNAWDDPSSVMNSGRLGTAKTWSSFSAYDVIAAQNLYPPVTTPFVSTFKTVINGPSSISTNSTVISTAGAMYDSGYYEWRMLDQSLNVVLPVSSFSNSPQQEWSHGTAGTYYLECRLVGLECTGEWGRQTVTFY
ncbi:M57 family metalloprotease [Pedobacter sp. GSP4]|uniref:M57 family metalloprotease n=1 Tax=Pedobacter sp. GSP4 TaxID=3453716 RepID=UPI003EEB4D64